LVCCKTRSSTPPNHLRRELVVQTITTRPIWFASKSVSIWCAAMPGTTFHCASCGCNSLSRLLSYMAQQMLSQASWGNGGGAKAASTREASTRNPWAREAHPSPDPRTGARACRTRGRTFGPRSFLIREASTRGAWAREAHPSPAPPLTWRTGACACRTREVVDEAFQMLQAVLGL
jgi:hypothetical protein